MSSVKFGKKTVGYKELRAYRRGKKLKLKDSILAKCYDCMCGYVDGEQDCRIKDCPLYPFMPFRKKA